MQLFYFFLLAFLPFAFHTERKDGIRNLEIKITKLVRGMVRVKRVNSGARNVAVLKVGWPWIISGRYSGPECFEQL